ncbi:gustatory receptor for sugar taste 64a-like [Diabrotica undecimpunctata]|uniref:gustatory receptor for sugar taste 64a-like n=1 Tax=Diabrotica undecimpunctata TaxID=50387 RepID=UPI003B63DE46
MATMNSKHVSVNLTKQKVNPTFHYVFRWLFLIMQIFGFMPIQGVFENRLEKVYFTWKSFRTIYAYLTLVGLFFMTADQVTRFFLFKVKLADIQRLWYFLKSFFVSIYFLSLAKQWNSFLLTWDEVDKNMYIFGKTKWIGGTVKCLMVVFIILFIGDYALNQIQRIEDKTDMLSSLQAWNIYQAKSRFSYIFDLVPYDFVSGVLLIFVHLQVLFAGTLLDIFIIAVSLSLAGKVQVVGKRMQKISASKNVSEKVWIHIREGYNRLEILCRYVNSKIGYAILISFIGNLGSLLIQLFNSLKVRSFIQETYLYYAFVFLLAKIVAVCIFASRINEESKKLLNYLYSAQNCIRNVEIDRLISQITRDTMALSGMNFFYLRRNIVLKIAGSIVTYELVLMEFAGSFLKEGQVTNRTSTL